jgi:hypothetical protein
MGTLMVVMGQRGDAIPCESRTPASARSKRSTGVSGLHDRDYVRLIDRVTYAPALPSAVTDR